MVQALCGQPCHSCAIFSDPKWRLESGVGYCDRFKVWHHPYNRPFDCPHHLSRNSLEGKMMVLGRALLHMQFGIEMFTGDIVETIAYLPHPSVRKTMK